MTTIDRGAVHDPSWPAKVDIYDTTLRDGSQLEGISLTVDDKLRIAEQLDLLGVGYIEGGWPGSNPKDDEFFARARTELHLSTSEFVAFGSTRRAKGRVDEDQTLANLAGAGTGVVCIVGKCWDYHVTEALRTTLDEGVAMVADSVEYLVGEGKRVFFDAEHFFDGYKRNPEFSLRIVEAAAMAGAEAVVLCDTNGGSLSPDVEAAVRDVVAHVDRPLDEAAGDLERDVHLLRCLGPPGEPAGFELRGVRDLHSTYGSDDDRLLHWRAAAEERGGEDHQRDRCLLHEWSSSIVCAVPMILAIPQGVQSDSAQPERGGGEAP